MKHKKFGFTLIEVALFLAITGVLFIGIAIGTGNSINNQRFYDTTQNFAEFLRSIYSQVSNPQGIGDGRSDRAIYGKLISFGQNLDLNGNPINSQQIFTYDVVGDATSGSSGSIQEILNSVKPTVTVTEQLSDGTTKIVPAGITEVYIPRWGAQIENVEGNAFEGTILVVRSPRSGTISTLYNSDAMQINQQIDAGNAVGITAGNFKAAELNFCINPDGPGATPAERFDVHLASGARNGSGVEVIDLDDADRNKCLR